MSPDFRRLDDELLRRALASLASPVRTINSEIKILNTCITKSMNSLGAAFNNLKNIKTRI